VGSNPTLSATPFIFLHLQFLVSRVFPNESGRPDKRHEFKLKRVAFYGKMNCGQCVSKHGNKCSEGPHCKVPL
jgi:hypothetical protein